MLCYSVQVLSLVLERAEEDLLGTQLDFLLSLATDYLKVAFVLSELFVDRLI